VEDSGAVMGLTGPVVVRATEKEEEAAKVTMTASES
jgi:hypothetical protein